MLSDFEDRMTTPFLQDHFDRRTSSNAIVKAFLADLRIYAVGIVESNLRDCILKFILFPTVLHVRDSLRA
jgi:hypothetical protein